MYKKSRLYFCNKIDIRKVVKLYEKGKITLQHRLTLVNKYMTMICKFRMFILLYYYNFVYYIPTYIIYYLNNLKILLNLFHFIFKQPVLGSLQLIGIPGC